MANRLSDPVIQELSLVFAHKGGKEWQPVNSEARILATKAEPKESGLARALATIKAYFTGDDAADAAPSSEDYPVSVPVADKIDGDGDGAQDYNAIASAICKVAYDIQSASSMTDENARSQAVVAAIDSFLAQLDKARSKKAEKSGARHSEADMKSMQDIADAHTAIGGALKDLGITAGSDPVEAKEGDEQDDAVPGDGDEEPAIIKAKKPDGEYGDDDEAGYADPGLQEDKKPRYPLKKDGKFNAERVRAAWSFIHQEKNADLYSAADLKKIEANIREAAKYTGVELESSKKAEESEMTSEQVQALIAEATTKAIEAVKAEMQPQIDAAKAEADKQSELAKAHEAQASQNAAILAAVGGTAQKSSALSAAVGMQKSSPLAQRMIAEMRNNPEPTQF